MRESSVGFRGDGYSNSSTLLAVSIREKKFTTTTGSEVCSTFLSGAGENMVGPLIEAV